MLDIFIRRDLASEIGQLRGLFKCEMNPGGAPLLGEKFLAIVLDQLQGRIRRIKSSRTRVMNNGQPVCDCVSRASLTRSESIFTKVTGVSAQ